jgi:ferredoxin
MPRIRFHNDRLDHQARAGISLAQAALEAGASLPFGCRAGTCGTCVCRVLSGSGYQEDRGYVERDTLEVVGAFGPGRRLACQIILRDEDLEVAW